MVKLMWRLVRILWICLLKKLTIFSCVYVYVCISEIGKNNVVKLMLETRPAGGEFVDRHDCMW